MNVLNNITSKYLLFSYNNEGLLSKDELTVIFKKFYNNVTLYEKDYIKHINFIIRIIDFYNRQMIYLIFTDLKLKFI